MYSSHYKLRPQICRMRTKQDLSHENIALLCYYNEKSLESIMSKQIRDRNQTRYLTLRRNGQFHMQKGLLKVMSEPHLVPDTQGDDVRPWTVFEGVGGLVLQHFLG